MIEKKPGQPTFDDEKPLNLQNATDFSPEEIEKYRKEAEHNVAVRLRADAAKLLVERLEREALSKGDPNEEMVEILIDVPGFADRITINGTAYLHNTIYTVPARLAADMRAQMHCSVGSWAHEKAYREPNRETYVRPRYRAFDNGAIAPTR